jgi:hypothetical protein
MDSLGVDQFLATLEQLGTVGFGKVRQPQTRATRTSVLKCRMRYGIALHEGGWVVQDHISGQTVTRPATSEEAQQAVAEWNARCVTRRVEPPVKVDGWGPAGELRVWLHAEDGWWGLVASRHGVRWMRAEDLRPSPPDMSDGGS